MKHYLTIAALATALASCNQSTDNEMASLNSAPKDSVVTAPATDDFNYVAEQFADLRVLRYQIKDFDKLPLQTKTLLYYCRKLPCADATLITTKTTNTIY